MCEQQTANDGRPATVGIVGMGGFAAIHHKAVAALEERGEARLVCTCDPCPENSAELRRRLERRGIPIYAELDEMLAAHARDLDIVAVPTPVPLHAPMHRAAVECGTAVYLEKPPTLWHRELEAMIEVDRGSETPTLVGFNFIGEPTRKRLKKRLLDGEFGALESLRFHAYWPRPASYYTRSAWAGTLLLDGRPVLDSCIGNALAHYVHNMLFWAGTDVASFASVRDVRAQLYRAHRIDSFDTAFVAARIGPAGIPLRIVGCHACRGKQDHLEVVECSRAVLRFHTRRGYRIHWKDGRAEETGPIEPLDGTLVMHNYRNRFQSLLNPRARPYTTLPDCRPFVHLIDLAFLSAGRITAVDAAYREEHVDGDRYTLEIAGIRDAGRRFLEQGLFPETSRFPWAAAESPGTKSPEDLETFTIDWIAARTPAPPAR